jgi:hypothetical protein
METPIKGKNGKKGEDEEGGKGLSTLGKDEGGKTKSPSSHVNVTRGGDEGDEGDEGDFDTSYLHPRYAVVNELDGTFEVLRAVLQIQCWARVVLAAWTTARVRETVRELRAAIMVQCAWRCKRAGRMVEKERRRWSRLLAMVQRKVEEGRGKIQTEVEEKREEIVVLRGVVEELRRAAERVEKERDEFKGGKMELEREVEGILEGKKREMEEVSGIRGGGRVGASER